MWWVFNTEPWRFRAEIAADGRAKFRWMSSRRTLDAAKRPVYLDLGGPLLRVTGDGPQGCVSGFGELLSRTEFIGSVGLRPLSDEELKQTSHYSVLRKDGDIPLRVMGCVTFAFGSQRSKACLNRAFARASGTRIARFTFI
jgi:hypothetical protein